MSVRPITASVRGRSPPAPGAKARDARLETALDDLQERLLEGALRYAERRCGTRLGNVLARTLAPLRRLLPRAPDGGASARGRRVPGGAGRGAVRYRVRGRDPGGRLAPGDEVDAYDRALRDVLRALRDPVSGALLVAEVSGAPVTGSPPRGAGAPDLRVTWRRDAVLELMRHDALGLVRSGWGGIPPLVR